MTRMRRGKQEVGREKQVSTAAKEWIPGWLHYGSMKDPVQDLSPKVSEEEQTTRAVKGQSCQQSHRHSMSVTGWDSEQVIAESGIWTIPWTLWLSTKAKLWSWTLLIYLILSEWNQPHWLAMYLSRVNVCDSGVHS